jgi:hypothetical protein
MVVKRKLKTRKCLVCDKEFQSFINRICPGCHQKYEKLFSTSLPAQWEDLIYNTPFEGDLPFLPDKEG